MQADSRKGGKAVRIVVTRSSVYRIVLLNISEVVLKVFRHGDVVLQESGVHRRWPCSGDITLREIHSCLTN